MRSSTARNSGSRRIRLPSSCSHSGGTGSCFASSAATLMSATPTVGRVDRVENSSPCIGSGVRAGSMRGVLAAVCVEQRTAVLALEVLEHQPGDVGTTLVVRAATCVRTVDDAPRVARPQPEPVAVEHRNRLAGMGRSRSRSVLAMTCAMRASPLIAATAVSSVPRTFTRGFNARGVVSETSSSPSAGSTSSM